MTDTVSREINRLLRSNNMVYTTDMWKAVEKGFYRILIRREFRVRIVYFIVIQRTNYGRMLSLLRVYGLLTVGRM